MKKTPRSSVAALAAIALVADETVTENAEVAPQFGASGFVHV